MHYVFVFLFKLCFLIYQKQLILYNIYLLYYYVCVYIILLKLILIKILLIIQKINAFQNKTKKTYLLTYLLNKNLGFILLRNLDFFFQVVYT